MVVVSMSDACAVRFTRQQAATVAGGREQQQRPPPQPEQLQTVSLPMLLLQSRK